MKRHGKYIEPGKKSRLETWAPMIISLAALGFAITESRRSREHERLSVRPMCSAILTVGPSDLTISIGNNGLGPATVAGFELSVNGSQMRDSADLLDYLGVGGFKGQEAKGIRGRSVMPGTKDPILIIKWDNPKDSLDTPQRLAINEKLASKLRTVLCYCSIYNECWSREEGAAVEPFINEIDGCPDGTGKQFSAFPYGRRLPK
jgi:hypothetical protein